jgi:hypothetical protein
MMELAMVAQRAIGRFWPRFKLVLGLSLALAGLGVGRVPPGSAGPPALVIGQAIETYGAAGQVHLRAEPGLSAKVRALLANGTPLVVIGGPAAADGFTWWEVEGTDGWGWIAEGLVRPVAELAAAPAACALAGAPYPGIFHCLRPGGVHVVVIDLRDPHVRLETVMAAEANGAGGLEAPVSAMAERYPGAVAAINANYFAPGRGGVEGLVVKNGVRLDTWGRVTHSALALGPAPLDPGGSRRTITAAVLAPGEAEAALAAAWPYTAVGGGPQVMFDGRWTWRETSPEQAGCGPAWTPGTAINGECFPNIAHWLNPVKLWTVAGLTADARLVWVVGPLRHLPATLAALEVVDAVKLDGGGSSQLWYERPVVAGYHPVANALVAYYVRSARLVSQPQAPTLPRGRAQRLWLTLQNTGAETWRAGEVELVNETPAPGQPAHVRLPHDVAPGGAITLAWTAGPFTHAGRHTSIWRLADRGQPFPAAPVTVRVVVTP